MNPFVGSHFVPGNLMTFVNRVARSCLRKHKEVVLAEVV